MHSTIEVVEGLYVCGYTPMPVSWLLDRSLSLGDTAAYSLLFYASPAASVSLVLALAGINLLWNPVIEQFPEDPESPGKPKVRLLTSPSEHFLS